MSPPRGASLRLFLLSTATTLAHAVNLPRQIVTNSSLPAVGPTGTAPVPGTTETVTLAGSITGLLEDSSILVIGSSTIPPSGAITIGSNTVSRDASSNVIVDGTTTVPIASLTDTSTAQTSANVPSQSSEINTGSTQTGPTALSSSTGPITLPPATTTLPPAIFTSSASSASSEIVALLPVISGWIDNPGGDTGPVISSIEGVQGELEGLLSSSGSSSTGCTPGKKIKRTTRKRDLISDTVNRIAGAITCAVEDLTKISGSIISGDITGVQGVLNGLTGVANTVGGNDGSDNSDNDGDDNDDNDDENDDDEENDDDNSSSQSESSTDTSSSSSCSSATAMLVTSNCVVSTITSDSSTSTTTTCTSSTTVETTGCSVTGSTTSVITTSSVSVPPQCASENCGGACDLQAGPATVSLSPGSTSSDCTFATTVTTDVAPTAVGGSLGPGSVDDSGSSAVPRAKRSNPVTPVEQPDLSSSANISIRMVDPADPKQYVSGLRPSAWVGQGPAVSGTFYWYNPMWIDSVGVNGIYGCLGVFVLAQGGAFVSHVWEIPVMSKGNWIDSDEETFQNGIRDLLDGSAQSTGISSLKGTDANPGPLHSTNNPRVVVVSPFTTKSGREDLGITTPLHYQQRTFEIAQTLSMALTGTTENSIVRGYERTTRDISTEENGYQGRAILEYDPFHRWETQGVGPNSPGWQIAKYRIWVADQNVFEQEILVPNPMDPLGISKRDEGSPNPCAADDDSSPTSSSPATTSSGSSTASTTASGSTSGSSSGFTTTTKATTTDPDNPLGLPTLSVTKCATSSCVNGQWIYSDLPTNSPCPTETITTGCLSTSADPTPTTSAAPPPPPPAEPALVCGNRQPNNDVDPFEPGVGVPVCFAYDMVSIFCSNDFAGYLPLIGGHLQPQTSIFRYKYESNPPNAATDALYISLQDVEDGECTPPVLEGDEGDGIDEQCVSTLMGIINDCDTQTGSKKLGGTHNINCQVWSIFPVSMDSVPDDSPNVWGGDADIVNDSWHYCNNPKHYLDVGQGDD